jgi:hypothetical protein
MKKNRMTLAQAHRLLGTKTQQEVADKLGTSQTTVAYWEKRGLPRWWETVVRERARAEAA